MKSELLKREIIHADETVVQVLKETGKKPTSNSYMWLYRSGKGKFEPDIVTQAPNIDLVFTTAETGLHLPRHTPVKDLNLMRLLWSI